MRKNLLLALLLVQTSWSLSLAEIDSLLNSRMLPVNFDIGFTTTVSAGGRSNTIVSKVLQSGKEKLRIEVASSFSHSVTIRNGNEIIVRDLKSGDEQRGDLTSLQSPDLNWSYSDLLRSGEYTEPVQEGALLRMDLVAGSSAEVATQSVWYDPAKNQIVRIEFLTADGAETTVELQWLEKKNWAYPKSSLITTNVNGVQAVVDIQYTKFLTPASLPAALFK